MSASSQATGHNCLDITIAPTTSVTLVGWVKINAFDKVVFDNVAEVGVGSGSSYRLLGLQQDPDGDGTADIFGFFWFNALTSGYASTPSTVITATGVWTFVCFVQNGTAVDFYWGIETGALSHAAFTADFSASVYTYCRLASDHAVVPEDCNGSYRGWRLWVDHVPSDLTAERNSATFAAVDTTGLVSALPLANGTSPGTASSGTNWTLTGTFADDASNPSFGGGTVDVDAGTDTPAVTDSETTSLEFGRALSDTAAFTDTEATTLEFGRVFSDSVSLTDSLAAGREIFVTTPGTRVVSNFLD